MSKFMFYAVTSDTGEIAANEEKICASLCIMLIFVPISWVKVTCVSEEFDPILMQTHAVCIWI